MRFPWILTLVVTLMIAVAVTVAAQAPEGMICREVTIVTYHAGSHWDDFNKHVNGHLEYLRTNMKSGRILYGGPFVTNNGGLTIYDSTDLASVEAMVRMDPLVVNKVVTHTLNKWRMCRPDEDK